MRQPTPHNKCPHCGGALATRSSRQEHPLIKIIYAQCKNIHCGATFQGSLEWQKQLSPSATPNQDILQQLQDVSHT